jgi:hypothetical protein
VDASLMGYKKAPISSGASTLGGGFYKLAAKKVYYLVVFYFSDNLL